MEIQLSGIRTIYSIWTGRSTQHNISGNHPNTFVRLRIWTFLIKSDPSVNMSGASGMSIVFYWWIEDLARY